MREIVRMREDLTGEYAPGKFTFSQHIDGIMGSVYYEFGWIDWSPVLIMIRDSHGANGVLGHARLELPMTWEIA